MGIFSQSDTVSEVYATFLSDGYISLLGQNIHSNPIKILRNIGASQYLVLADIISFSEESSSGKSVLFQGVECGLVKIPLHHVNLTSDLVSGPVLGLFCLWMVFMCYWGMTWMVISDGQPQCD